MNFGSKMSECEQNGFLNVDTLVINNSDNKISVEAELLGESNFKGVKSMTSEEYKAMIEKLYFK